MITDMANTRVSIVVPGRPVPAVRMTGRGKFVKANAQRYLEYKDMVGWIAKKHFVEPLKGDISFLAKFYLYRGHTPDIDNLLKAAMDSLNGIAWLDDRQVYNVEATRCQVSVKTSERMEIYLVEVNGYATT